MEIKTTLYTDTIKRNTDGGRHIIGYQTDDSIVVYQAYKPAIATAAVAEQRLGGGGFNYHRMSWIKPGFLWMMYRCGWATKTDQERVLALWLKKENFKKILEEAVPTTFKPTQYTSDTEWKEALKRKDVRLQWDPDHNPYGEKLEQRAIQLGLKDKMLEDFGKAFVYRIEDITPFVQEQYTFVQQRRLEELMIPIETIVEIEDSVLKQKIGL